MTASRHTIVAFAAIAAVAAASAAPVHAGTNADTSAFGKACQTQSKKRVAGAKGTSFSRCVIAMSRLARGRSRSAQIACATLTRKRSRFAQRSPFDKCVRAGHRLTRHGNGIDRSYVEEMIPHHVSAVEMAQLALRSAQTEYVRALAQSIIISQNAEIAKMRSIAAKLKAGRIPPATLGLSKREMGMDHDISHLVGADPFDVHFVDMMIPHHEGAITMSRVLFAKGASAETRRLAEQITFDQKREIEQMRQFRASATGSPAPAPAGAGEGGHH